MGLAVGSCQSGEMEMAMACSVGAYCSMDIQSYGYVPKYVRYCRLYDWLLYWGFGEVRRALHQSRFSGSILRLYELVRVSAVFRGCTAIVL